jgi:protein O-mannosyl-transferase
VLNQPNDKGLIDVEMADVPAQQQQLTFIERNNFSCLIYGLIAFAILLVTGCIVYSNTLGAPFVFDDIRSINDNIYIRMTAFTPEQIARIGNSPLSRPVANFSFALNYYFHQYHPAGYHIVNILIHVTVAFLVFLIAFQTLCLCKTESIFKTSLLAGLIWLAHPLHTQSVTYVVQRMSSLAAMFYLLALFCYVKARMIRKDSRGASIKKVVLFSTVILAGVLGVGSKPIVITLPVLLFLYEWLFLKRLDSLWLRTSFRRLMILVAVLLLFSFFYLDVGLYDAIQATYDAQNFSMGTRLLTELQIIIYYSSLLVFPHPSRLNLDYDYPLSQSLLAPPATIFSLMAILSLLLIAFYLAKRHRLVVFTIFWFLTTLIVESSFIGLAPLFEHRTYLPSVFPVIVIITLFSQVAISRSIKTSLLIVLFCIGALWTYQRNAVWTDAIYLWENCVQKSPLKARPQIGRAHV